MVINNKFMWFLWFVFFFFIACSESTKNPNSQNNDFVVNNLADEKEAQKISTDTTQKTLKTSASEQKNLQISDISSAGWGNNLNTNINATKFNSDSTSNEIKTELSANTSNANISQTKMMPKGDEFDTKTKMMAKPEELDSSKTKMMPKGDEFDTKTKMMAKPEELDSSKTKMMTKPEEEKFKNVNPRSVIKSAEDITTEKLNFIEKTKEKLKAATTNTYAVNNNLVGNKLKVTRFIGNGGEVLDIEDYADKKIVLVILRGFAGGICLVCSAQTLALSESVERFAEKDAQIILVYPGKAETVPQFIEVLSAVHENFEPPFPVVLDVELQLVESLSIDGSLAKPTSIITDDKGNILYAYIGKGISDRPTVDSLLKEVEKLSDK